MRKLISGLLAAIAVVALSACGGGGSKSPVVNADTTGSSTSSSSSSSDAAAGGVSGDFCEELAKVDPVTIADDPTGAKAAVETLKKLDPPSEIESQWADYLEAIDEIANTDPNNQAKLSQIAQSHIQSLSAVGLYIAQSCVSAFSGSIPNFSSSGG